MKKTFKVVMLPTKEEANIFLKDNITLLQIPTKTLNSLKGIAMNLYIISDEHAKPGEYILGWQHGLDGTAETGAKHYLKFHDESPAAKLSSICVGAGKVVATTDTSLKVTPTSWNVEDKDSIRTKLPQLPEAFIQAYIKAYNEGKPITEVDLESYFTHETEGDKFLCIKTRPDNTVIVHQSKMYTRAEVIAAIIKYNDAFINFEATAKFGFMDTAKWIEENL